MSVGSQSQPVNPFIVLIGPRGVGKSTTADGLATVLGCSCHCVDAHALTTYRDDARFAAAYRGGDTLVEVLDRLQTELGHPYYDFEESLHLMAIERTVADPPAPVIDFGAGHTGLIRPAYRARAVQLLASLPCVCLWPSRSPERSVKLLETRLPGLSPKLIAWELECDFSRDLASLTIHVDGASIRQVIEQILDYIRTPGTGKSCSPT
jgi:hypothetical protein